MFRTHQHVRAFRWGKGFMSSVESDSGGTMKNGSVHSGTGEDAYQRAISEGETDFQKKMEEVDRIGQQIANAKE